MQISAFAATAFLPFVLPICFYVAWSDMRAMKIPNISVIVLALVFVVVGPFVGAGSEGAHVGFEVAFVFVVRVVGVTFPLG